MSPREVRDAALSAIIARKMAKIHSLRAPINKQRDWLTKMFARYLGQIRQLSPRGEEEEEEEEELDPRSRSHRLATPLLQFDFNKEIQWLM